MPAFLDAPPHPMGPISLEREAMAGKPSPGQGKLLLLPVQVTLSPVSPAEQGMPGGGLSVRETPLLVVSTAWEFGVSSLHPIQLFLWDLAPAKRCLPFSRVLQTRRHTLPAPLCSPRQPPNTRPGPARRSRPRSSAAAAGRERVLPPPAQSNKLPKTSSSFFHIFPGSLFPSAGQAASFWEDSQALAWRSAKGGPGRRGGAKVPGQEGVPQLPPAAGQSAEQTLQLGQFGSGGGIYRCREGGSARGKVVSVGH